MMYNRTTERTATKFVEYLQRTWKNKITAIVLILGGMLPVALDGDGTALLFFGCIAIPMFFAKKNWMMW